MKKHWLYLKYVLRHKLYVYQAGRKLGLPILMLLLHDWDKFLPGEWFPYVNNFYGQDEVSEMATDMWFKSGMSAVDIQKAPTLPEIRDSIIKDRQRAFDKAWLYHQNQNQHHWQYWMLVFDKGNTKLLPIPEKYILEMIADWRGAGKAIAGKEDCVEWYLDNRNNMKIHPESIKRIEQLLNIAEGTV